jgi:hypothetical protein
MEKDIERWIQKDFFHNLDTLKYLAENDLSAIEITRELENLRNTKDEVFEGLESLGVRAHSSRKLIPNYLKEKENDAPPFLMPGFMKYEEPTDEEFEPEGGLHTAEDVLNTMVGKTKAYEVWLRDKIRDIYQRYESIRNITLSTNYTFDEDVARLYSGAMKLDLNNSLGTVFEVVQAENKGMAILPDYITTAKFRLPSSVEGEFPTIRGVNIYPINTNSSRSIVIYPFLNSEFEELMKCEFGPAFHYNRGLAVIDLAPGQKFNNKEEWVEFLGNTLGKFGYIAERTTELNWKDKLKDKAKPDENSDR